MFPRFRRNGAVDRQRPPPWVQPSRFLTSHLDPPSPEEQNWPPTPPSATDSDSRSVGSALTLWPNPSSPVVTGGKPLSTKGRHIPIDISKYQVTELPVHDYADDCTGKSTTTTRLPRYVPIIIPDFAQPFAHELRSATSESDINTLRALSTPTTPTANTENRYSKSLDAVNIISLTVESVTHKCPTPAIYDQGSVMNNSQVSLVASEASSEAPNGTAQPANAAGGNTGLGPGVSQQGSAPTNLSGLVCNVHRTTGDEPPALVGATTTVLGDKLYVFGGRIHSRTKPQLTSDLYELDLIRRHWVKVDAVGDIPPPRYFHSVCALGDSKLVCYGGMSPAAHNRNAGSTEPQPEVVVMSDVHVFDVPTRKWTLIATAEHPQGRYAHCAAILPSSAVFTSASAPLSAIHHNPSSGDPHSGTLGVHLDGTGGAEMIVVGGQDSNNNYIEQISVFNLRSLKWTNTTAWDRKCGAYKSMVAPLTGLSAENIGRGVPLQEPRGSSREGTSMLIYSNYNFLDVKLELQIRLPDGSLIEKPMTGPVSPPGLRFPNGGIIDGHFVVSGTYLTSSKHEYALWALDLKTLTWARIDTNGSIFSQGSWNRGILWNRRNTFVILGHRKRSLVDDYNHRRINFSHVCMVELEAFGLYDNPRRVAPTSSYVSVSAPAVPLSLQSSLPTQTAGGRPFNAMAEQLGQAALSMSELADMEIVALGGEKIPCNSFILSRRWGPFFNQLLAESASTQENASMSDAATLRPTHNARSQANPNRNSSITITPNHATNGYGPPPSGSSSVAGTDGFLDPQRSLSRSTNRTLVELPNTTSVPASSRPRSLYMPHMAATIQLLLHFFYTSSLPPVGSALCTPHTLCSLLQMARPYQIDGLLEATVERLHEVLDGRNSAAVFNAAAMAAGGGRGLTGAAAGGMLATSMPLSRRRESQATTIAPETVAGRMAGLKLATSYEEQQPNRRKSHGKASSIDSTSTATSASTSTDVSHPPTDNETSTQENHGDRASGAGGADGRGSQQQQQQQREIWTGDISSVIGLQKRGLRGLMEGRRLRERANTGGAGAAATTSTGVGIGMGIGIGAGGE
ncbi:hypothetical protein HRR83_003097 [Exophiala dermatitidis]|uniref:BTB domain-containing protein n=1 Tax=Exophiala dermatitidis TaxID=5970 RepID=A0AAN6ENM8_EXODE|nr:hypothetical protein HRR73_008158 [Exophiala dermatitidis]KAJ4506941.1 hypothetical protein HRR74_008257 [Exophiala dermatitidis]KAJ4580149.1 hypothetical protein HRR81_002313 [Exophiala dermatitidis]KAJ4585327.1 hypothetical protein HRR82_002407 [Exophiala dermatitidis]KAJ4598331.1 hypothetical protein HRR84_003705 [Exophiala dermatitidis]